MLKLQALAGKEDKKLAKTIVCVRLCGYVGVMAIMQTKPLDLQTTRESLLVVEDVAQTLRDVLAWLEGNEAPLQVFNLPTFALAIEKLAKSEAAIRTSLRKAASGNPLTAETLKPRAKVEAKPAAAARTAALAAGLGAKARVVSKQEEAEADARSLQDEQDLKNPASTTVGRKPAKKIKPTEIKKASSSASTRVRKRG